MRQITCMVMSVTFSKKFFIVIQSFKHSSNSVDELDLVVKRLDSWINSELVDLIFRAQ